MVKLDGFTRRTKEKMKNIEEATISLLIKAPDDIKISDIANKANVSQVTIYNYYGSKEKLIEAAVLRLTREQIQWFEQLIEADMPFKEKLKQFLSFKKQTAGQYGIYKLAFQSSKADEFLTDVYTQTLHLFMKFIQSGRQSGYIRESVKDETLLFYLRMIERSISHLEQDLAAISDYELISEGIIDLLFYGIFIQKENTSGI
ncbi:TetR/AcrR family transcriptional regulator [Paenibacillus piri]|uniref:TetR/AcrR family transcriptional regulator n=1 Tax=Paenibacillus piri TaxID=2547395 RepID=A0A4R5KFA1_9BACL|nr:TetR/AcrR family transcriptional regulator [Paenibacillus piri]TDF92937.1 TetR/AcrR family transcriptional regulator [Paenibacillus piri]